jgi:hypothetical protein
MSAVWGGGSGGGVRPGDPIYLTFSEPVTSNSAQAGDFGLPVSGDTFGAGATVSNGQNEGNPKLITVTLQGVPCLTPGGTYLSGALTPGAPTGVYVADGTRLVDGAGNAALVQIVETAVDLQPGAESVSICWDDLSIAPKDWNLGDRAAGATFAASSYFTPNGLVARNNGTVVEKFTLSCSTSYPTGWTVASAAGQNQFALKAANSGPPYTVYPIDLGTGTKVLATQVYSGHDQPFDLQIALPAAESAGVDVAQTICVTITATKE